MIDSGIDHNVKTVSLKALPFSGLPPWMTRNSAALENGTALQNLTATDSQFKLDFALAIDELATGALQAPARVDIDRTNRSREKKWQCSLQFAQIQASASKVRLFLPYP